MKFALQFPVCRAFGGGGVDYSYRIYIQRPIICILHVFMKLTRVALCDIFPFK